MATDASSQPSAVFLQIVGAAIARLKSELQNDYEQAYPGLGEIVHLVLDEEEARARKLSVFPHLFLPDLVQEHIARLGLLPAETRHEEVRTRPMFMPNESLQPAFANLSQ